MVEEQNLEFVKPWKCEGPCGAYMYNKTPDGHPSEGAPVGYTIDLGEGKSIRVCSLCKDMWLTAASNKFLCREHVKWELQNAKAERLKPGKNYLED